MTAAVAELRARHNIPESALKRLQSILAQQQMTGEQRLARLDELAGWLAATVAHLRAPSNEAAEARRVKAQAADALEAGELERAMDLLKAIREHVREARRRAEARLAEELQTLKAQMTEEAAATARLGELAMARHDLDAAAEHFADASGQLPAEQPALELGYRYRRAEALAAKAETTGEPGAIEAAAAAYRVCLRLVTPERDAARGPDQRRARRHAAGARRAASAIQHRARRGGECVRRGGWRDRPGRAGRCSGRWCSSPTRPP